MKAKLFPVILLFGFVASFFVSCGDNTNVDFDLNWRDKNDQLFKELVEQGDYYRLNSTLSTFESDGGSTQSVPLYLLWRPSNTIIDAGISPRITPEGKPLINDSVKCRYEAWFFDKTDTKVLYGSTEKPVGEGYPDPNKIAVGFILGGNTGTHPILVEGVRTALLNMTEGEERELVIPWRLAYGEFGYNSLTIPGFTNIYINIKLTKIVSMVGP